MLLAILLAAGCSAPEYHALDFWIGTWDVTADGHYDGENVIAPALSGCAIREQWTDANGSTGESLFYYDRALGHWKQVWITSDGTWKEKSQIKAPEGSIRFGGASGRTTLLKLPGGSVRQVIESAKATSWTGIYTRRAGTCMSEKHREMDFWLGDWTVNVRAPKSPGSDEWTEARGSNHVSLQDGGCTVVESFHAAGPGAPWSGRSFSQLQKQGVWRQTWVSDQNEFLVFTGGPQGSDFVLTGETAPLPGGGEQRMRMVFSEIGKASFKWRWEATVDGGKTWAPRLFIDYARSRD
jgi:hypothetical protein